MASRSIGGAALAAALSLSACGDDTSPADAGELDGSPTGDDAGGRDAGVPSPSAPVRPTFTPCPAGFRDAPLDGAGDGLRFCDPWPETGPADCPDGEMHLPGEPGCEPVAGPCPVDGFPEGLPTDGSVVFLRAAAAPGGDGTRGAPFATLADAVAAVPPDGTVAIAPGTYDGDVATLRPMTLWGGCLDAVIRGTSGALIPRANLTVRSLRIDSAGSAFISLAGSIRGQDVLITGAPDGVLFVNSDLFELEHSSIRGAGSSAFLGTSEGRIVLRRVEMRDVGDTPFRLTDTTLDVERSVIRGVRPGTPISSILTAEGATVIGIRESALVDLASSTLFVLDASQITISDTLVSTALGTAVLDTDTGMTALAGTSITLERVVLLRPTMQAVVVTGAGASTTLRDVVVADVLPGGALGRGQFLEVSMGGSATVERVHVDSAVGFGLFVVGASEVVASDLRIEDTLPALDGTYGRAIQVQSGARLDATRVVVDGAREAGIVVATPTTVASFIDLQVSGTLESACTPGPTCISAGIGMGVYLGGRAMVERFLVDGNALLGAQLALDGQLDLTDGIVRGHPVGVNVQVPGYDVTRLTRGVAYVDNLVNLDSSDLPLPSVGP